MIYYYHDPEKIGKRTYRLLTENLIGCFAVIRKWVEEVRYPLILSAEGRTNFKNDRFQNKPGILPLGFKL